MLIGTAFVICLPGVFVAKDLSRKCDVIMQLTAGLQANGNAVRQLA